MRAIEAKKEVSRDDGYYEVVVSFWDGQVDDTAAVLAVTPYLAACDTELPRVEFSGPLPSLKLSLEEIDTFSDDIRTELAEDAADRRAEMRALREEARAEW